MGRQLVARERELAEVLTAATDGHGAVLSGPAGVGKTALAAVVAERVEASGDRVERIVATEASRSISFGALAPLLPDDVSPLHPALVAAAPSTAARTSSAGPGRPLLVVDDAHLLDDHSAAAVLGLVTSGCGACRGHRARGRAGARRRARPVEGRLRRPPRDRAVRPRRRRGGSSPSVLGGEVGHGTASCCGSTPAATRSTSASWSATPDRTSGSSTSTACGCGGAT